MIELNEGVLYQRTGAGTEDKRIFYPKTIASQVLYNDSTVAETLDNIGTNLENKFVTLDTDQIIYGSKTFREELKLEGISASFAPKLSFSEERSDREVTLGLDGFYVSDSDGERTITFPNKSGRLLVDGDIPRIGILPKGSGNAITDITASGHVLTVTKGTFATTDVASTTKNGLMSSTDKKNLDTVMGIIGSETGDPDEFVNTVRELLEAFSKWPEGVNVITYIDDKLGNYVTLDTDQIIDGSKTFREELKLEGISASFAPKLSFSEERSDREVTLGLDGFYVSDSDGERTITFPNKSGRLLVDGDIPKIPTSLPPSGNAGGDLTGTYPNPTIGAGKVTEAKIGSGAVTEGKIGANAVTTGKIKDGNVTNLKLDKTGVVAGDYSAVTVNEQGRVTKGAQFFMAGDEEALPAELAIGGLYFYITNTRTVA